MKKLIITVLILGIFQTVHTAAPDHTLFTAVLKDHVRNGMVNYRTLKSDKRLDRYCSYLQTVNPGALPDSKQRLAFWINAYNAFTLKLVVDNYPVSSIRDIKSGLLKSVWDIPFIVINDRTYTLNNIEHDIIRKQFSDPRIHAGLVCAAESCPPLRREAYTGHRLNDQLADQMRRFLSDERKNSFDPGNRIAYLSKIFQWYGKDFGPDKTSVLINVARYAPGPEKNDLLKNASQWNVRYLPYSWKLNRIKQ